VVLDPRTERRGSLAGLAPRGSLVLDRFRDRALGPRLREAAASGRYDVIQLDGLAPALFLDDVRAAARGTIVYRAHNVEHDIWRQRAEACRIPLLRPVLRREARRVLEAERRVWAGVDGVAAISAAVAGACAAEGRPTADIPVAVDPALAERTPPARDVHYLGDMAWAPNREGMRWFLRDVWPEVRDRHPSVELHVGGRGSGRLSARGAGVVAHGVVADSAAFHDAHGIMVAPVRQGSGLRVKVLEAMARGRPVVSTTLGADGIGARHGEEILLADGPDAFAGAVRRLLDDPAAAADLGQRAAAFAARRFSRASVSRRMDAFLRSLR
jgi:glycosyltransferase involved in cell wall biosynthesis